MRTIALVPRVLPSLPPPLRRALTVGALLIAVLAPLYLFWLRDLPLVAVDRVSVSGVTARDGDRLRAKLTAAARDMTTLHLRVDALERAASSHPAVSRIDADPDFPHAVHIRVIEHRPVALAGSVPVAADGTILRGVPVNGRLPQLPARGAPGARLRDPRSLASLHVLAAAPHELLGRVEDARREGARGWVARLRDGPEVIIGGVDRLAAKWAAAVSVIADDTARGATYVDVRLPDRPAAGGVAAAAEAAPQQAPGADVPEAETDAPPAPDAAVPNAPPQMDTQP